MTNDDNIRPVQRQFKKSSKSALNRLKQFHPRLWQFAN